MVVESLTGSDSDRQLIPFARRLQVERKKGHGMQNSLGGNEGCCLDRMYIWFELVICRQVIVPSCLCFLASARCFMAWCIASNSWCILGTSAFWNVFLLICYNSFFYTFVPSSPNRWFMDTSYSVRWHFLSQYFELSSLLASSKFVKEKRYHERPKMLRNVNSFWFRTPVNAVSALMAKIRLVKL